MSKVTEDTLWVRVESKLHFYRQVKNNADHNNRMMHQQDAALLDVLEGLSELKSQVARIAKVQASLASQKD